MYVLRSAGIPNNLIYEALARCYHCTFMSEPGQRNWHLLFVATAHAVCNYVYFVAGLKKIDGGLGNADVTFYPNDDTRKRTVGVEGVKGFLYFRRTITISVSIDMRGVLSVHHGEKRLVLMADGLDAIRLIQLQLWTCLTQASSVLCGGEYGDVQDLA
jgi:hypothetical protein